MVYWVPETGLDSGEGIPQYAERRCHMTPTKSRGWLTCALVLSSIIAWGCVPRSREPATASRGPREMSAAEREILENARRENFSTSADRKAAIADCASRAR